MAVAAVAEVASGRDGLPETLRFSDDEGSPAHQDDARPALSLAGGPRVGVVSFTTNGGTLVFINTTDLDLARVRVGIDAAVVADHHITIRQTMTDGQVRLPRFHDPRRSRACPG